MNYKISGKLENPVVHDTEKAIKTAIEAIKVLIKG